MPQENKIYILNGTHSTDLKENIRFIHEALDPTTLVARKATLPVQNGTNLKVDFFECLDPLRYHMGKKFGFHRCP